MKKLSMKLALGVFICSLGFSFHLANASTQSAVVNSNPFSSSSLSPLGSSSSSGTYTLTYIAGAGGTISGPASQSIASGHSGVFVSAIPDSGYAFTRWSDGSIQNPRAETYVTANVYVTASFAPVGAGTYYTVSYTAGGGGTISGNSFQSVLRGSAAAMVTAVPDSGHVFYQWADNGSTNPVRQDTNVTHQIAAQAQFTATAMNTNYNNSTTPTCNYPATWSYATNSCQTPIIAPTPAVTPVVTPTTAQLLGSGVCPANLLVTDNLRIGAHDGQFDLYQGGTVTQVNVLQRQINRILAASYNDAAGPTDGSFGPLTKQGVERLQIALNQILKPNPLLKIDGIVGPFTKAQMNNSCGMMH